MNENIVVTTKDWLSATDSMRITAYDPSEADYEADSATTKDNNAQLEMENLQEDRLFGTHMRQAIAAFRGRL